MKRTILALVLMGVVALGGAFATGQSESWQTDGFGEETSLKGTFTLVEGFPALETSAGTYTLGAPRAAWVASTIEEGTEMEVEGYLITEPAGPRGYREAPASAGHLRVTSATIDGETYDVTGPAAGPGMMGRAGYSGGPGWNYHGHMGAWGGYPRGGHSRGGMMGAPGGSYGGRFDQSGRGWNQPDAPGQGYRWDQQRESPRGMMETPRAPYGGYDDGYRRRW